jgi:hypothetical protein
LIPKKLCVMMQKSSTFSRDSHSRSIFCAR